MQPSWPRVALVSAQGDFFHLTAINEPLPGGWEWAADALGVLEIECRLAADACPQVLEKFNQHEGVVLLCESSVLNANAYIAQFVPDVSRRISPQYHASLASYFNFGSDRNNADRVVGIAINNQNYEIDLGWVAFNRDGEAEEQPLLDLPLLHELFHHAQKLFNVDIDIHENELFEVLVKCAEIFGEVHTMVFNQELRQSYSEFDEKWVETLSRAAEQYCYSPSALIQATRESGKSVDWPTSGILNNENAGHWLYSEHSLLAPYLRSVVLYMNGLETSPYDEDQLKYQLAFVMLREVESFFFSPEEHSLLKDLLDGAWQPDATEAAALIRGLCARVERFPQALESLYLTLEENPGFDAVDKAIASGWRAPWEGEGLFPPPAYASRSA